jgi:hypothetical protein
MRMRSAREAGRRGAWGRATAAPGAGWICLLALLAVAAEAGAAARPGARGYLTTPLELSILREKADEGIEPYASARSAVLAQAAQAWLWGFNAHETCPDSDSPGWNDNGGGTPVLYATALAWGLTGDASHAARVAALLQAIMSQVLDFDLEECQLHVAWGTPELVASADLIEDYWEGLTCTGPLTPTPGAPTLGAGPCKRLFQNWLAKNAYHVVSLLTSRSQNNRGAAATNAAAYVADYLWDRDDVLLVHRNPSRINQGVPYLLTPAQAFAHANRLALDRMNGYSIHLGSGASCDYLSGPWQSPAYPPVKSQITPGGIIPEDARRQQYCNVPVYDGTYQNYPQGHIGSNVQQCELMLRRGDRSCYDNEDASLLSDYPVLGPDGVLRTTYLLPGRGSLERAIKAVVVDSRTEWRHDPALEVAYRYYRHHGRLLGSGAWLAQIDDRSACYQDVCLATLTHGFALEFPLKAYDAPDGSEATLSDVDLASGASRVPLEYAACAESAGAVNAVRGVGTVTGLAYFRDRLYGLEAAGSPPGADAYLFEMAPSPCAQGARVGPQPVGFAGLEALAACPDGSLYGADFDPAARRARLIRIDRATGVGSAVGSHAMAQDLRVVGLACAADGHRLWALSSGAGARPAELVAVDPATGVEMVIGPTGTPANALQALELDRSGGGTRLLAAGTALYELDPGSGAATPLGGSFAGVRALAMPEPTAGPDSDDDGRIDPQDNCRDLPNEGWVDADADGFGNLCDGDFDGDGVVGTLDLLRVAAGFGSSAAEAAYDPAVDLGSDGTIGVPDVLPFARSFGRPPGPSGLACAGAPPCP